MKLRQIAISSGVVILDAMTTSCSNQSQSSKAEFDRMHLPIAEPKPDKVTKLLPSEVPLPHSGK